MSFLEQGVEHWPRVRCPTERVAALARRMRHQRSAAHPRPSGGRLRQGETRWAARLDGQWAGLDWEWGEVRPGVVALADPMHLRSNIEWVDASGVPLDGSRGLLHLNELVYRLDWQWAVSCPEERDGEPMATSREFDWLCQFSTTQSTRQAIRAP